jgi:hypothetical protein
VYAITVEVKGTRNLPNFLNVNSDSAYAPLPTNWTCLPSDYDPATTDNLFHCTATIAARTTTTVMVSTGSKLAVAARGSSVTVITTVTAEDAPASLPLPAPVSLSGAVA